MILIQKDRNQYLFLVRKSKHDCSCCAQKKKALAFWWPFLFRLWYRDRFIYYKNPSHFGWSKLLKKCIFEHIHIFYVWFIVNTSRVHDWHTIRKNSTLSGTIYVMCNNLVAKKGVERNFGNEIFWKKCRHAYICIY